MEDDRDGCGPQVRGAATQGEEEHQSRAKAKGKKIANAFGSSSGAGGSRLASDIGDRPTSPAVVTRSGELIFAKLVIFLLFELIFAKLELAVVCVEIYI